MPQTARLTAAGCRANRGIAPSQALNKAAPFGDEAEDDAEGEKAVHRAGTWGRSTAAGGVGARGGCGCPPGAAPGRGGPAALRATEVLGTLVAGRWTHRAPGLG